MGLGEVCLLMNIGSCLVAPKARKAEKRAAQTGFSSATYMLKMPNSPLLPNYFLRIYQICIAGTVSRILMPLHPSLSAALVIFIDDLLGDTVE